MRDQVVVIDHRCVELHDAFMRFVPQVFPHASFRRWYELGGWDSDYRAFAIFSGSEIVANVSVQRMKVIFDGAVRTGWQLGAVGVLRNWRGRGLQRTLMGAVLQELGHDFAFLFANEDVLDFYPQFGFRNVTEWVFGIQQSAEPLLGTWRRLDVANALDRELLARIAATAQPVTQRFGAMNYATILLWYWTNARGYEFLYHPIEDAIVIVEQDVDVLRICDVLSAKYVDLGSYVSQLICAPITHVEFGFTPELYWPNAQSEFEYLEAPLFVRGDAQLPSEPFKFPLLAQT